MVDNFAGQPPISPQVVGQPQNRAPAQTQITDTTGHILNVNADGTLSVVSTSATGVGQMPMASSLPVVIALDQTYVQGRDFPQGVAQGAIPGYSCTVREGANSAVSTTETFVSTAGGSGPYMPTSAVTLEAISTSANDTASTGSGARTIIVEGLDASFAYQTASISLTGTTTSSATVSTFIRALRSWVDTAGTYGSANAGDITIRKSGAGTTFLTILTGNGQTKSAHYCVRAGHTVYMYDFHYTVESNKSVSFNIYQRQNADVTSAPVSSVRVVSKYFSVAGAQDFDYKGAPRAFPAKTDIWVTATSASGTAGATAEFTLMEN